MSGKLSRGALAFPMLLFTALPIVALVAASSPSDLAAGARHPLFLPALALSARTTAVSMLVLAVAGTPLAWWLARGSGRRIGAAEILIDLPVVVPPAVMGVALLQALGPSGLLGPPFAALGITLPFTTAAVIVAQVVVSAPFYIRGAASAFRGVDDDLLAVARTLGQSPAGAFARVAIPVALPGMVAAGALSWARALGEFGATLFFAGNLAGVTQTMPLAIYAALESNSRTAVALALFLAAASVLLLVPLRMAPTILALGGRAPGRTP